MLFFLIQEGQSLKDAHVIQAFLPLFEEVSQSVVVDQVLPLLVSASIFLDQPPSQKA
jgi:hypothetical protein